MLSSRLPWQPYLFSSQTKTFVSEITGRIRAWKQADSCSEDLPLAIQIGQLQCLLLVGFNGKVCLFHSGPVYYWRFCPFLHLEWSDGVSEKLLPISTSATQERVAAARLPSAHCHTAFRNAGMTSAMLVGDRQMTSLTQLLRRPVEIGQK